MFDLTNKKSTVEMSRQKLSFIDSDTTFFLQLITFALHVLTVEAADLCTKSCTKFKEMKTEMKHQDTQFDLQQFIHFYNKK